MLYIPVPNRKQGLESKSLVFPIVTRSTPEVTGIQILMDDELLSGFMTTEARVGCGFLNLGVNQQK